MSAFDLRPYQTTDTDRLRAAYAAGAKAPIYQLATGGGKTVTFAHVIQSAAAKGRKVGVFVHRRELIKQASAKLAALGVPHGVMAAGMDRDHGLAVQVLSIQSAQRRELPAFDFIVIDEAHHARADTWQKLLESQPQAKLLGVTATPARTDGKGLGTEFGGIFDAIVCGPSMAKLIEDKYLVPAKCMVPARVIDVTGLKKVAGDFKGEELAQRAAIVTGDAVKEYAKHAAGKSAIAFCCTIAHAEAVAEAFRAAGYRSECVHGGTHKEQRDALLAGLGNGEMDVLTSCDLISEGLDIPSVGAVILLRPTGSLILCLQQIGRGMRPSEGKESLIVLDHAGNTNRHGLPEEDRIWTLAGVEKAPAPKKKADPETEGMGKPREVIMIDGELVLATKDAKEHARWINVSYGAFKRHPRSSEQVYAYARVKGYKKGWAFHFLQEQAQRNWSKAA